MIGVGIGAVEVERFRRVLARQPRLAARLIPEARAGAHGASGGGPIRPNGSPPARRHEAVLKALGVGLGGGRFPGDRGSPCPGRGPSLLLYGRAAALARDQAVRT